MSIFSSLLFILTILESRDPHSLYLPSRFFLGPNTGIKFIMKNSSCLNQVPFKMNPAPDSDVRIRIRTRIKKNRWIRIHILIFLLVFLSLSSIFFLNANLVRCGGLGQKTIQLWPPSHPPRPEGNNKMGLRGFLKKGSSVLLVRLPLKKATNQASYQNQHPCP